MPQTPEVELRNVSKRFADIIAVDRISLDIGRGEFLTLLGPSGCGKTTLLRMIAGFDVPDEGRVFLGGEDVTERPPYKRDVTTVFQQYALFPHMDVRANVAFGLERRRLSRAEINRRVADALEMVQLSRSESRLPNELSGGQQQRVALARALVVEPRVLLLDEPLAALDLKLRKQMQLELKRLQRRVGISFIYVTHDQEEALTMSDRIVVMNAGRIEQIGSAATIYEKPQTEFVAGFIGVSNLLEGAVVAFENGYSIIAVGSSRIKLNRSQYDIGARVRVMVRPEKISIGPGSTESESERLAGRIDSAIYLGESTHWIVELEDGQRLTVLEQNREASSNHMSRSGQRVSLRWEPDAAVVLDTNPIGS